MFVYLDNNSTTFPDPRIAEFASRLFDTGLANPASQHRFGRKSLAVLENAKCSILQSLHARDQGVDADRVIVTSGGTESNNLAIRGWAESRSGKLIIGSTEHPSVLQCANQLYPARTMMLRCDQHGRYCMQQLEEYLVSNAASGIGTALVSLMMANNETGVLQDIATAGRLCSQYDVPLHCDAVQAVGRVPVDIDAMKISALTFTAHKIHGPVGIGALVCSPSFPIRPILFGGGQQLDTRPGTEPVLMVALLAECLKWAEEALNNGIYEEVRVMRSHFESRLMSLDNVVHNGCFIESDRVAHCSNLSFEGIDRQAFQMALDLEGVACSTGSACASGSARPSHVLQAMGLADSRVNSALRFSFARLNTLGEVEDASDTVAELVSRLRTSA